MTTKIMKKDDNSHQQQMLCWVKSDSMEIKIEAKSGSSQKFKTLTQVKTFKSTVLNCEANYL